MAAVDWIRRFTVPRAAGYSDTDVQPGLDHSAARYDGAPVTEGKPGKNDGVKARSSPTGTRPKLSDVAAAAGVTGSIASRVLNGDPSVSTRHETRQRIFDAARRLSYTPNALARGLRRSQTMTMGLVLPNLAYAVNTEIIRGAERQAAAEGYVVVLADAREFGPTGTAYQRLVMEGRVDGLLVASTIMGEWGFDPLAGRLPVVHVNRRGDDRLGVSVSVDDERGVGVGVDHLVRLGHTEIGYVGGPRNIDTARRRRDGFLGRMQDHGLVAPGSRMVETALTESGGFRAMKRLLATKRPPTAVTTGSFASAVGVMSAIVRAGLRIPEDISVVGFHDAPIGDYLTPRLTTIRMPLGEMAAAAVQTLTELINVGESQGLIIETPAPMLVERDSTGPPPM
jgi:LacI family transcriptional regulator